MLELEEVRFASEGAYIIRRLRLDEDGTAVLDVPPDPASLFQPVRILDGAGECLGPELPIHRQHNEGLRRDLERLMKVALPKLRRSWLDVGSEWMKALLRFHEALDREERPQIRGGPPAGWVEFGYLERRASVSRSFVARIENQTLTWEEFVVLRQWSELPWKCRHVGWCLGDLQVPTRGAVVLASQAERSSGHRRWRPASGTTRSVPSGRSEDLRLESEAPAFLLQHRTTCEGDIRIEWSAEVGHHPVEVFRPRLAVMPTGVEVRVHRNDRVLGTTITRPDGALPVGWVEDVRVEHQNYVAANGSSTTTVMAQNDGEHPHRFVWMVQVPVDEPRRILHLDPNAELTHDGWAQIPMDVPAHGRATTELTLEARARGG